ncbi:hypothetical protein N9L68_06040 [bacterium]|nr:hypothetical protein [bacterium]
MEMERKAKRWIRWANVKRERGHSRPTQAPEFVPAPGSGSAEGAKGE